MAALPFSTRRPFSSPCFILCFLLGFVAGLFPFAHRHLHLDLDLRHLPLADPPPAAPTQRALVRPPPTTTLIVVTPTRARPLQAYYLHRLAHTLRLVPQPLLWLVVDRGAATRETAALLRGCGLMYRHLPSQSHRDAPGARRTRPEHPAARGLRQRNAALDHIEHHRIHGLVYFADEDNVYSLDLFDQLRGIRSFGTWPVAMLGVGKSKTLVEGPVCDNSQVVGWHTNERTKRQRRFHVNTSGFAFNSSMLWDADKRARQAWNYIRLLDTVRDGFQATTFIEQLVEDETHMEGIPTGCSKIMNVNLRLEDKHLVYPKEWQMTENLDVLIPL
ncbi:glycosyltransferase [Zea mays]|uniref:Glycosyltransferases n=1 Tax=Zea mays TaxID=4577 RepID=Q50HW2_MAIZE|nr:glycosyltransferase [Zea mays]AQK89319.1 putative beta-14-xylosyltransferase IRX9H [Zea mays]CAI93176.1 glycosyltransferase [Zea mays]|eukprot:NP_001105783.1 glycosyltransferase [Zea mays]